MEFYSFHSKNSTLSAIVCAKFCIIIKELLKFFQTQILPRDVSPFCSLSRPWVYSQWISTENSHKYYKQILYSVALWNQFNAESFSTYRCIYGPISAVNLLRQVVEAPKRYKKFNTFIHRNNTEWKRTEVHCDCIKIIPTHVPNSKLIISATKTLNCNMLISSIFNMLPSRCAVLNAFFLDLLLFLRFSFQHLQQQQFVWIIYLFHFMAANIYLKVYEFRLVL